MWDFHIYTSTPQKNCAKVVRWVEVTLIDCVAHVKATTVTSSLLIFTARADFFFYCDMKQTGIRFFTISFEM